MPLTAKSAVIRRLVVSPGPAGHDTAPVQASAAGISAVLRAFGRSPEDLPVRTVVYVGANAPSPALAPEHEGFAVRTASSPGRALRLAHRELLDGTADFALVAGFGELDAGSITVYAVKRAAEAVADGDPVIGTLDLGTTTGPGAPADPDTTPPLAALDHGHRLTEPAHHRLLLWSGRDEGDEERVRGELVPMLSGLHCEGFPALPTVLPCGTEPGPVRAAAVTVASLAAATVHKAKPVATRRPRPVALLFPGQGSQHHGMAAGLYGREPVFTAAVDAALSHMGAEAPQIRADWLTAGRTRIPIDDVRRAQPLLFAVDYALGRMVISWGIRPAAVLGHSAGELVAATIAGAVALPDAVAMVMERVRQAVKIPPGGMLAVAADEQRLRPYLGADVAIAAVNANQQTMLAGSAAPLAEVAERLRADGLTVVTVPATSPFHSPAMAPASAAVEAAYQGIPLRPPT
ncbi:MAG: [acyl-carrier-protein] S-malonyltransferase, partial [Streptomyces sp.]|nr:[acyl-carrier-protein] S-malonyltransferase [Streptomyces sp.]